MHLHLTLLKRKKIIYTSKSQTIILAGFSTETQKSGAVDVAYMRHW